MKVADLGEARHISALGQYEKPPSPARNWIPPEIVPKDSPATNYTAKSEVYAVCIVAAEVMNMSYNFVVVVVFVFVFLVVNLLHAFDFVFILCL